MRLVTILFLTALTSSFAQDRVQPRPSPLAIASTRYKDTYLKITYSQPSKNGRAVFGKLVPYDQVWRTGANEATEITITRDVRINGTELKAGTYSLFTIPGLENWTIILNTETGLWGAYNYNPRMDLMRWQTPVIRSSDSIFESFTILIDQKNDKADIRISWDDVTVIIPVQFNEPKS